MGSRKDLVRNCERAHNKTKIVNGGSKLISCQELEADVRKANEFKGPQQQTVLSLIKEVEDLEFCDLKTYVPRCPPKAVQFKANEKIYSDLIELSVTGECTNRRKRVDFGLPHVDSTPNEEAFMKYSLPEPFLFKESYVSEISQPSSISSRHSLWHSLQKWKDNT